MFSIIIPLFNKVEYIERTILSIKNQTFNDYEIIVVNDGSTDGSEELVRKIFGNIVTIIDQENKGVSSARNTGIKNSKFEFIAFLDADDVWSPFYLEKNHEVIRSKPDVMIIGSNYKRNIEDIENEDNSLKFRLVKDYFKHAIQNTVFFTSATIVRRSFFLEHSGFNSKLQFAEDLDVWFRVMLLNKPAIFIENTLVYYSNESNQQWVATYDNFKKRMLYNLESLYFKNPKIALNKEFIYFLSKFTYSGLYKFHNTGIPEIEIELNKIYKNIRKRFFLADLYYQIPYLKKYKAFGNIYFKVIFNFLYK